ncbi:MAG: DUF433 domain-containing protein [Candidatus Obscuribacterales bacterium]|nr:DUF433 domain-containing protein [Candidatus Obscuribacterales bacterium]
MIGKTELLKRITIESGKCGGRPCLRGTRKRVVDVLQLLSSGADYAEILRDYPSLEHEDILACLEYEARQTDHAILQSEAKLECFGV